ncbi:hypothetical protein [Flagellimonas flava]|uniref:DUF5655 domain-containing protein n=1 Tax=Flagellimonas flava TaxID=570519 RepID=A0A1M5N0Y7_9FLAO|nr:hypothetical protein [Allomuricauda flava]SHG83201.1 hypothetical protein SAMN04488116_2600 [Allomuricauda flava]
MDKRTDEIIIRFENSWNNTEAFYRNLLEKHTGFNFVAPILEFIQELKNSGESKNFRLGTSMHTLIISRSVEHGLREDQKEIRIEKVNNLPDGFEYEVIMRQGKNVFRVYRVHNLNDEKVLNLLATLKETLID